MNSNISSINYSSSNGASLQIKRFGEYNQTIHKSLGDSYNISSILNSNNVLQSTDKFPNLTRNFSDVTDLVMDAFSDPVMTMNTPSHSNIESIPYDLLNHGSKTLHQSSQEKKTVINKLNNIAKGEEGKNGKEYQEWCGYGTDYNWCAMFISWLYGHIDDGIKNGKGKYIKKIEVGAGDIPRDSVPAGLGVWYKSEYKDQNVTPRAGDIIFFNPIIDGSYVAYPNHNGDEYYSSHVGYVYKVDDKCVYTVEGNTQSYDASTSIVSLKQYDRTDPKINGYYRPNY